MTKPTWQEIRDHLGLEWLEPEGGWIAQSFVSNIMIEASALPEDYTEDRPVYGAIYYLLNNEPNCFSEMHSLTSDEVWHFYFGDPVEMLLLYPDGKSERVTLGHDILNKQKEQYVKCRAPGGVMMGAHVLPGGDYALMGTMMAPAYSPGEYDRGIRADLIKQYPQEADLIHRLTRIDGRDKKA